ncbi:helix-turn-helix transcriptional regulator [Gordonia terrae]|uniref:LuxR family transcriptional regulator n=2 Tax=Gordonia terrae TaxID=2055 RepID=A0AAD0KBI8_9ACTN|nr:helix-turn-helix transcriptional regulator [Gordonia terrae]VTR09556.1 two component LuxR family transcriptional regulator [Clostridioides difficile]ANY22173.1 hypothetical protein BCM27_04550 [Gordonia terrae]AWO82916.1 LuxR family transcriptional regulator [Gordonia terrae]VTS29034.1 transcriptional regulator NarP [Gordonia terrae]GAB46366.1 hypothetical protein GOTRE_150_01090 [Gordonia terrae NBRC 100016]
MDFDTTLCEVSRVAAESVPGRAEDDLRQILEMLVEWFPFVGCSVASYDSVERRHSTVVSSGYPPNVLEHLDGWFVMHDEAFSFMATVDPTPRRWRDFPFDYRGSYSIQEVFGPTGYKDGTTMRLHTRDGRYTGCVHVNTDSSTAFTAVDVARLHRFQGVLGAVVDRQRTINALAASMTPVHGGTALVRPDGSVTELPGAVPGDALSRNPGLAAAILRSDLSQLDHGHGRWRDESGQWHTVVVRKVREGLLVREWVEPLPHALTSAELYVLDGLTRGLSNSEIARSIGCSNRTIAKHLEHIFPKIGCRSRTHAAVLAVSEGMRIVR